MTMKSVTLIVVILLSFMSLRGRTAPLVSDTVEYRCPPCGCCNDSDSFSGPGFCPACGMALIPINEGMEATVDEWLGPLLEDGALGPLYPKLIYPVFLVGILFAIFQLLARYRGQKALNPFLSGLILVMALYGFKNQLYGVQNGITDNWRTLFMPLSGILWLGPLYLLYIRSTLRSSYAWKRRDFFHFLPGFLFFIAYSILFLSPERIQRAFMISPFEIIFSHAEQILSICLGFVYWYGAKIELAVAKSLPDQHQKDFLGWLQRSLIGFLGLFVVWGTIIGLNSWLYQFGVTTLTYNPLWITIGLMLFWCSFEIIRQPELFLMAADSKPSKTSAKKLDKELLERKIHLETLMQQQKPYTDPELSLSKLAQSMEVPSRYLSAVLNNAVGKSFYEFVNQYRVEEVKKLLRDPANSNLTIEAIANQAGFKSKSTFNAAFKKQVHMTPRQFLKLESQERNTSKPKK